MFEGSRRRGPVRTFTVLGLLAALGAGVAWLGDPLPRALLIGSGVNPLASPFATAHQDFAYAESPLAVSLAIEATQDEVDPGSVLALADTIARELGFWMLATSGRSDLDAAERWLWDQDQIEALAVRWAWIVREHEIYIRDALGPLSRGVPQDPPRYAHLDELPLLLAHTAWRLDLRGEWVRSPRHEYLVLRGSDGTRALGIEATAFRHVTERGVRIRPDEPSVGLLLSFPPDLYSGGSGGIRNPDPPWPGTYAPIPADELRGALTARIAARRQWALADLQAAWDSAPSLPLAQALYVRALAEGLAAWEADDLPRVQGSLDLLASLRAAHGDWLRPLPEEDVLAAMVRSARGEDGLALLHPLFARWETDDPPLRPKSDAHAAAMWLDLAHGPPDLADWNRRIVPLLNHIGDDSTAIERLCVHARRLRPTAGEIDMVLPRCSPARP